MDSGGFNLQGYWPRWLVIVSMSAGWSLAWAIGLFAIYNFEPFAGWVELGAAGGLVTALVLRLSRRYANAKLMLVVIGWVGGGLCSAAVTNYGVLIGWATMAALGGGITGLTGIGSTRPNTFLAIILGMAGWIAGGLMGVGVALTGGREAGLYVGTVVGGRAGQFMVWGTAWAMGGAVAGAAGGAVTSWQNSATRARFP